MQRCITRYSQYWTRDYTPSQPTANTRRNPAITNTKRQSRRVQKPAPSPQQNNKHQYRMQKSVPANPRTETQLRQHPVSRLALPR
eukprot:8426352-Pyramimonas_sp.AAC.1